MAVPSPWPSPRGEGDVEALWDDIAKRNHVPPPTEAQRAELDRRLADHEANPDDVVPWSDVKASALADIG